MSVVKSLVGSVVGAAIATGIYYGIQQSTGESYIWCPLVTGTLTGVVARMFGGASSNAASFVCGALAALVAGVATFGVDLGPKFMEMSAKQGKIEKSELMEDPGSLVKPIPPAVETNGSDDGSGDSDTSDESGEGESTDSGSDSAEDESSTDTNDPSDITKRGEVPEAVQKAAEGGPAPGSSGALPKKEETWVDLYLPYIFNGIGMIFAYQLARGFGPGTPKESKEA